MTVDRMWDGFSRAVVHLELPSGPCSLRPAEPGRVGLFPFEAAVHVVTAYNPAGRETDDRENARRHLALKALLSGGRYLPSAGSAPDGTMREPGFALLGVQTTCALDMARNFGQRAICRWTEDALFIIGVDEPVKIRLGWTLD